MGMFDYVEFQMSCPVCRKMIRNFQTKIQKSFAKYTIDDIPIGYKFYAVCPNCKLWVTFEKMKRDEKE